MACNLFSLLALQYVTFVTSLKGKLQKVKDSKKKKETATVLIGIFTQEQNEEKHYRRQFRDVFRHHPYTCTLHELKAHREAPRLENECKLVYAFVFGSNKEPDAPTEIIGRETQIEITESPANLLNESKEGDLVLLNIRENMNQGKSFTWLYYASNYLSGHLGIDYIGKVDTDTLISMHSYFQFHEKFLFPTPMNTNTLVGHFLDKRTTWRVNELEREKETHFRTRWESVHVYCAGEVYIMSVDLANATAASAWLRPDVRQLHSEMVEDHDVSTMAFLSTEDSKNPMNLIMIAKDKKWWTHPLKRHRNIEMWSRLWQEEKEEVLASFL